MNIPNQLTIFRLFLVPFLLITFLFSFPYSHILSLLFFLLATLTDFFDGYLARKMNQITTLGKFLDPLADKLLVFSVFLYLTQLHLFPFWVVFFIFARELAVSGLRQIAAIQQRILAADIFGKIKTVIQFIVLFLFLYQSQIHSFLSYISQDILIFFTFFITIFSGFYYFYKNFDVFKE